MKSGIEFFPLDVHLDDKFKLIQAEYGLTGFAVIVKLLQRIYGEFGYYCEWTEDVALLFASDECKLGGNVVSEILLSAIRRGIFNNELFEKYRILTSRGIQIRYLNAVERRKKVDIDARFLLVDDESLLRNVNIINQNVNISDENVNIFQQSKVKESKVKESKDLAKGAIFIALPLNDGTEYNVYEADVKSLEELYQAVNVRQELRNMKGWLNGNPKNRKTKAGINRFINGWLARTQNSPGWGRQKPQPKAEWDDELDKIFGG